MKRYGELVLELDKLPRLTKWYDEMFLYTKNQLFNRKIKNVTTIYENLFIYMIIRVNIKKQDIMTKHKEVIL